MPELTDLIPPPERELPPALRASVLDHIAVPERTGRPWSARRRSRRAAALAFAAVALAAAATAYAVTRLTADQTAGTVTCFSRPSTEAPFAFTAAATGGDPTAICAAAWRDGNMGVGGISTPPPLVACAGSGGADVFPSNDPGLCARLGLDPLPPGYTEAARRVAAVRQELAARIQASRCVAEGRAVRIANSALHSHDLAGWSVRRRGFTSASQCASTEIDASNRAVVVIGRVRPELTAAVEAALRKAHWCGPAGRLRTGVEGAIAAAGQGSWRVIVEPGLTTRYPCVDGYDVRPASRTIVLVGGATG